MIAIFGSWTRRLGSFCCPKLNLQITSQQQCGVHPWESVSAVFFQRWLTMGCRQNSFALCGWLLPKSPGWTKKSGCWWVGWVLDVHFRHSPGSNTMYNELKFCDLCNFLVVVVWRNAFRLEVWFSAQTGDSLQVLQFDQELNGLVIFGSACCHPLRELVQSEGKEFERMDNVWAWMDMFSPYSGNSVDYIMHLQKSDKFQCPWQNTVWPRMNQIIQTANSLLKNLCLHKRRSLRIQHPHAQCKQTQPKQFDSLNDIHASTSSTKQDSKWTSDSWWWIISLFIQLVRTECIETTLCSSSPS